MTVMPLRIENKINVHTNNHWRPVLALADLPAKEREWFDYVTEDEFFEPRFIRYMGSAYDLREFEVAPDSIKALGFDGVQTESYFSCVAVRWFDADGEYRGQDEVVVARMHW